MNAQSIMRTKFISFQQDELMEKAIHWFLSTAEGEVPIVDEQQRFVGTLTEQSLFSFLNPPIEEGVYNFEVFFEQFKERQLDNRIQRLKSLCIQEYSFENIHETIHVDDTLEEIIVRFSKNNLRQMPVIGKSDRLVGMVDRKTIMNLIFRTT